MNFKHMRWILIALVLIALVSFAMNSTSPGGGNKSSTLSEEVLCLSAVCVSDEKLGQECIEFHPNVARVVLAQDLNVAGANRLIVENNSYQCR